MKISLISWIVSTETDPREEGHPLLEPFPGSTPADKAHFEPLKEASLKHLTIKTVFLLALGSGKRRVRSMLGCITTSDTRLVHGVFLPFSQPSFQESAGQRESRQCGPVVNAALIPTLDKSQVLVSSQSPVLPSG